MPLSATEMFAETQRTFQCSLQNCCSLVSKRQLWDTLAVKVKHVTEMEKDCVLVFDEMAMKRKLAYNNVYGTYFGKRSTVNADLTFE